MRFYISLLLVLSLFCNTKLLVRAQYFSVDDHQHQSHSSKLNTLNASLFVLLLIVLFYIAYRYFDRYCQERWWAHETAQRAQLGLNPSILETFPVFLYSEVSELGADKGPLECAVCLSQFEKDEKLRKLPKCEHMFHLECVNRWLAGHTTCPLCRAELAPRPDDDSSQARPNCVNEPGSGSREEANRATVDDVV